MKKESSKLTPLKKLTLALQDVESGACDFTYTGGPPPSIEVRVKSEKITEADVPLLKSLFGHFFQENLPFELTVKFEQPSGIFIKYVSLDKDNFKKNDPNNVSLHLLFEDAKILQYPNVAKALMLTLNEHSGALDVDLWLKKLSVRIILVINKNFDLSRSEITEYVNNFLNLYTITGNPKVIAHLLPNLLHLLIKKDALHLFPEINNEPFLTALKELDGNPLSFLHLAMQENNLEAFNLILKLIGGKPKIVLDENGNTFLHVCNDEKLFTRALALSPSINHQNNNGETPLHTASYSGNINKANFLLKNNANPEITNLANETFWNKLPDKNRDALHLYRFYKMNGHVLMLPTPMPIQLGLNCGYYAAAFSATHHRGWKPELFKERFIPARKIDTQPRSTTSLRKMRKELGIGGQGAIFSVQDLAKVIEKTECKSLICEINDYQQFWTVIKKSIALNLPVIIPFATKGDLSGEPDTDPKGDTAHWATIIGWAENSDVQAVLLAQYEGYYDTNAQHLFKSFYEIDPVFPKHYLWKKTGEDWKIEKHEVLASDEIKTDVIPLTDLTDFRRKLVVVLPPNFDLTLLDFSIPNPTPTPQNK